MTRCTRLLSSLALALTLAAPAWAVTRGGTVTFARAVDCIYLDPVHTAQNADIWISLNIYDTLLQPTPDGKSRAAGPGGRIHQRVAGRQDPHAEAAPRPEIRGRLPAAGQRRRLVASNRASKKETGGEFRFLLASIENAEAQR